MDSMSREVCFECIKFILNNWAEFQWAVAQGCGGSNSKEKTTWLPGAIADWLGHPTNCGANESELEEALDGILNEEFNLEISDGSVIQICKKILDAQSLCLNGRYDEAKKKYCVDLTVKLPSFVRENNDSSSDDDNDDEAMDVTENDEPPQLVSSTPSNNNNKKDAAPKVDEDGWEVVTSRKNRNK